MATLRDAVSRAADFITPFLTDGGDIQRKQECLSEILLENAPVDDERRGREGAVRKALSFLQEIHNTDQASPQDAPYDGTLVAMVYGLIDLVVLQGVRPSICSSARNNRRPQSVLVPVASTVTPRNIPLLAEVTRSFCSILSERNSGISPLIRERALSDIIFGAAELAFSPDVTVEMHSESLEQYDKLTEHTSVVHLIPVLPVMGDAPPWLRSALTHTFARIPLRPYGVRQLIELISLGHGSSVPSSQGIIAQVVNMLTLPPPPPMTRDAWYDRMASQLWGLLDGDAGPEMSEAAGQIIASILARKSLGAPGMVGWKVFAEPLLQSLNPTYEESTKESKLSRKSKLALGTALVPESTLLQGLKRVAILTTSHPHPGLAKRLISPIVLPLWGLLGHANQFPRSSSIWANLSRSILLRYFQIVETSKFLDLIASNLLWDGQPAWTYGPGGQGGIEIRRRFRGEGGLGDVENIIARLQILDRRVGAFTSLLVDGKVNDDVVNTIFLSATKRWLSSTRGTKIASSSLTDGLEEDPLQILMNAKLCEAMSSELRANFASHPKHVLELAKTLLEDFVENKKSAQRHDARTNQSIYASLQHVVQGEVTEGLPASIGAPDADPEEDIAAFSISLIHTILGNSNFKMSAETERLLFEVAPILEVISSQNSKLQIVATTRNAATTVLSLIPSVRNSNAVSTTSEAFAESRSTLSMAISELQSPEPPIRAHALSTIRGLANSVEESHIIDIPSTTHNIVSLSLSDHDSYVHTAAIPTLVSLAALAPTLVTGMLTEAFVDEDETALKVASKNQKLSSETENIITSLELRLRIGETLHSILSTPALWDPNSQSDITSTRRALHTIISSTLTLSSRRGPHRQKTLSARKAAAAEQIRIREEGEEAWGGEMPSLGTDEPETPYQRQERETLERIVGGWEDTGLEEDVRICASALSILGSAMEERFGDVRQTELDKAVEIVLGCLVLERGAEKAILRRAAVLVLLGVLKGMDKGLEERPISDDVAMVGLGVGKWEEVERVLKWVRSEDLDELVQGHAGAVLEGLETWRIKSWFGLRTEKSEDEERRLTMGLEGGLRGLAIDPDNAKKGKRMVEEVE